MIYFILGFVVGAFIGVLLNLNSKNYKVKMQNNSIETNSLEAVKSWVNELEKEQGE